MLILVETVAVRLFYSKMNNGRKLMSYKEYQATHFFEYLENLDNVEDINSVKMINSNLDPRCVLVPAFLCYLLQVLGAGY